MNWKYTTAYEISKYLKYYTVTFTYIMHTTFKTLYIELHTDLQYVEINEYVRMFIIGFCILLRVILNYK
jgi:hypothetical protein